MNIKIITEYGIEHFEHAINNFLAHPRLIKSLKISMDELYLKSFILWQKPNHNRPLAKTKVKVFTRYLDTELEDDLNLWIMDNEPTIIDTFIGAFDDSPSRLIAVVWYKDQE